MKETVPEEVVRETTKCPTGHSCLCRDTMKPQRCCHGCDVDFVLGRNLMFVKPKDPAALSCPYKMHYGKGHVCHCPVRYYLFVTQP